MTATASKRATGKRRKPATASKQAKNKQRKRAAPAKPVRRRRRRAVVPALAAATRKIARLVPAVYDRPAAQPATNAGELNSPALDSGALDSPALDRPALEGSAPTTSQDATVSASGILTFRRAPSSGATAIVDVVLTRTLDALGTIRWDKKYRQYAYWPTPRSLYTIRTLGDIQAELQFLMNEWALRTGRAPR